MDDTAQTTQPTQQNSLPLQHAPVEDNAAQSHPVQQPPVQTLPLQHTPAPVSSGHKELAPMPHPEPASVAPEAIKPTEHEPQLSEEVKEVGVETVPEHPKVPEIAKQAGLAPAKEATPVQTQPSGAVQLPSFQQAEADVKKYSVIDAAKWRAAIVLKEIKMNVLGKKGH